MKKLKNTKLTKAKKNEILAKLNDVLPDINWNRRDDRDDIIGCVINVASVYGDLYVIEDAFKNKYFLRLSDMQISDYRISQDFRLNEIVNEDIFLFNNLPDREFLATMEIYPKETKFFFNLSNMKMSDSLIIDLHKQINDNLYILECNQGHKNFLELSTMKNFGWFISYEEIENDLYLIKGSEKIKDTKVFFRPSDPTYTTYEENFMSYNKINDDLYILNRSNGQKSFFRPSDMKMTGWASFKSFDVIHEDLYTLKHKDSFSFFIPSKLMYMGPEFKSHTRINENLWVIKERTGDNAFLRLSDMKKSHWFLSFNKVDEDIYILKGTHNHTVFFRLSDMKNIDCCISPEKINNDTYLIKHYYGGMSFVKLSEMALSARLFLESYHKITEDLYLLNNFNEHKAFIKLSSLKISDWQICEDIEIGKKISMVSKAGSKSELNLRTLQFGSWKF
jgi:hypothetical protein